MKIKGINFSPKYSTGSIGERNKTVQKIRDQIFLHVVNQYDSPKVVKDTHVEFGHKHYIPINSIKKLLKDILPEKLKFNVKKHPPTDKENSGSILQHINEHGDIRYYTMTLPSKKNHLYIDDIPSMMHEVNHLLDFAINPQYQNTIRKIFQKDLDKNFEKLFGYTYYTNNIYNKFKIMKKTKQAIKNLSVEDKLIFLKNLELELKTEQNSYNCMDIYVKKLNQYQKRHLHYRQNIYDTYNFEKKIKLVRKMRYEIIKNERKKLAYNQEKLKITNKKN